MYVRGNRLGNAPPYSRLKVVFYKNKNLLAKSGEGGGPQRRRERVRCFGGGREFSDHGIFESSPPGTRATCATTHAHCRVAVAVCHGVAVLLPAA